MAPIALRLSTLTGPVPADPITNSTDHTGAPAAARFETERWREGVRERERERERERYRERERERERE